MNVDNANLTSAIQKLSMINAFAAGLNIDIENLSVQELKLDLFRRKRIKEKPYDYFKPSTKRRPGCIYAHAMPADNDYNESNLKKYFQDSIIIDKVSGILRYNFDGLITSSGGSLNINALQIFRNKSLEVYEAGVIYKNEKTPGDLSIAQIKTLVICIVEGLLEYFKKLEAQNPFVFCFSLLEVENCQLATENHFRDLAFERDNYLYPPVTACEEDIKNPKDIAYSLYMPIIQSAAMQLDS